ncbi:EthD domain-containing protein [Novosphingobium sp. SG751A]|uniref:EthD domain-containing protein n=1 Tax=Novosphingobium sp. SG751A TaxID=2587000 RepID=UPI001557BF88
MLKIIIGGRRRAGMTHAEYSHYAEHCHGGTVAHNPGSMETYMQNHILDAAFGTKEDGWISGADFDSFSEISFADGTAFAQSLADPYYHDTIQPDELNFVCQSRVILLATRVEEQPVAHPGTARLKLMRFIASNGRADAESFEAQWQAEAKRIADHSALKPMLRRMTRSISLDGFAAQLPAGFIANAPLSPYVGVDSLWLDAEDDDQAIAAYRLAIEEAESALLPLLERRSEILFIVEERSIVA